MVDSSRAIGVRDGAKDESCAITEGGRVITDSMANMEARINSTKEVKAIKVEYKEVKQDSNSGVQKIEPEKLLEDLLPSGFNAIVSEKLESGKAWHFPYSNTYMINKDDWNMFLTQITAIVNEARKSESLELNAIKPSDDPALGPLIGLMGDIFSA